MFDGDNDGSGAMLPWVCVFVGLQRKIETFKMKEKKMKKNKLAMLKTNEKKMKSLGQRKIKSMKRG
jgi:hypothetical protein